jgi:C-terminal processing protease CtpA/Prc
MNRYVVVLRVLSLFTLFSFCLAQSCDTSQTKSLMSMSERKQLFGDVWSTVRDQYIYTDFRGVDWQAARKAYSKQILGVKTNADFYTTVDQMILELGDDHSVYLTPWSACEEDSYSDEDLAPYEPTAKRLEVQPSVLYIDIPSFNLYDVPEVLNRELRRTLGQGQVRAVILDLRHNYGGYLDAAYAVLSTFVRGRLGTEYDLYGKTPVRREPGLFYRQLKNVPIVVFVDADTHSAAELVAGILEEKRDALIIGQTSAGNTEIVLPFDFRDGSRLWLAVGGFQLEDGSEIEGHGVVPEVMIDKTAKDDVYIEAGLEALGLTTRATQE